LTVPEKVAHNCFLHVFVNGVTEQLGKNMCMKMFHSISAKHL